MRLLTIMTIFLLIGVFFIISEKRLNVADTTDLKVLKNDYGKWLINTAKSSAVFVGQVIKMEWLPNTKGDEKLLEVNKTENASG